MPFMGPVLPTLPEWQLKPVSPAALIVRLYAVVFQTFFCLSLTGDGCIASAYNHGINQSFLNA